MKLASILQPMRKKGGFTLVELLIAMGMLAVVTAAIFALYNTQHRVTTIEEDVVDVQQNIRIALDAVARDMMSSGMGVAGGTNPISVVSDNGGLGGTDMVTINTASLSGVMGRIDADVTANVVAGTNITFTVASASQANLFTAGDVVRILNIPDKNQPLDTTFTVAAVDNTVPSVTLTPAASGANILFKKGYIISRTGGVYPNTLLFCVGPAAGCGPLVTSCPAGQTCLMRILNGVADDGSVLATNVQNFQVKYIQDGSTAEVDAPADLSTVRAARFTLTGRTVDTAALSGGQKTRELTTVAKIRNR
ncbi:MAG: prepilin-type N-terminal cleavage/methylation domain-containing protein [Deltaproteobacteria bacterium]|nr:prepilin-type N-terminal cleavage/methylation domain-containing protein [Deltaproteobacteria bacterium]